MKKTMILILILVISSFSSFSQQPSLDTLKEKNLSLYGFVKEWVGVKYRIGGNTKSGIDCSGFSKKLYETIFGVDIPRTAKLQYNFSNKVKPREDLMTGDLVFFRTRTATTWHVGVYLSDGYFIHSSNRRTGVKISSLYEDYYMRTYLSGGRII